MKKRDLLLGIILMVVIFLVVLFVKISRKEPAQPVSQGSHTVVKPTTFQETQTKTWEAKNNPSQDFSFTYPQKAVPQNVSQDTISLTGSNEEADPDAPVTGIHISTMQGDVVMNNLNQTKSLFASSKIENTTVDGVPATMISGTGTGVFEGKFIKFVEVLRNGKTTELSYFEGDPTVDIATFDQILATFKFTD